MLVPVWVVQFHEVVEAIGFCVRISTVEAEDLVGSRDSMRRYGFGPEVFRCRCFFIIAVVSFWGAVLDCCISPERLVVRSRA